MQKTRKSRKEFRGRVKKTIEFRNTLYLYKHFVFFVKLIQLIWTNLPMPLCKRRQKDCTCRYRIKLFFSGFICCFHSYVRLKLRVKASYHDLGNHGPCKRDVAQAIPTKEKMHLKLVNRWRIDTRKEPSIVISMSHEQYTSC